MELVEQSKDSDTSAVLHEAARGVRSAGLPALRGRAVARRPRIRYHLCVFIVNFQIRGRTTMPIPQVLLRRFRIAFTRRRPCVSDPCVGFDP
jgi:hypothetical protein